MNLKYILPFLIGVLLSLSITAKDIYVSPSGNDSNDGSKKLPIKSISLAHEMAVNLLETGKEAEITIWLAGGTYSISEALVFKPFTSDRENAILIFNKITN